MYRAVIKQLQQNKGLDESQATQLFEKYYRPVYKHWGMEPNAEEFADTQKPLRKKRALSTGRS